MMRNTHQLENQLSITLSAFVNQILLHTS